MNYSFLRYNLIIGVIVVAEAIGAHSSDIFNSSESNFCGKYCLRNCSEKYRNGSVEHFKCEKANDECFCTALFTICITVVIVGFLMSILLPEITEAILRIKRTLKLEKERNAALALPTATKTDTNPTQPTPDNVGHIEMGSLALGIQPST